MLPLLAAVRFGKPHVSCHRHLVKQRHRLVNSPTNASLVASAACAVPPMHCVPAAPLPFLPVVLALLS